MATRRPRKGTGSKVAWLKETGDDAVRTVPNLDFLGDPWCVVGAVAANLYMSPRYAADLDIAVLASDRARVHQALAGHGYRHVRDLGIPGSTWATPDGRTIDVLALGQPWAADAMRTADGARIAGIPVMPLAYLVLMKLEASRSIDVGDHSRMLGLGSDPQLADARALVKRWMPDDAEDVERLIALGRAELES